MKGYVANTDYGWYSLLHARSDLEEVNFWQPGGGRPIKTVEPFAPFFFRLKKPYDVIAGFGHLVDFSRLPAWLAWETFGEKNGTSTQDEMFRRIRKYRTSDREKPVGNLEIGCQMIASPVFFDPQDWIPHPSDWAKNIVQGRTYDLTRDEGRRIWEACLARTEHATPALREPSSIDLPGGWGEGRMVRPRIGQGTFRVAVTEAYAWACAVTREHSLPVIEAAHIKPFGQVGRHELTNGLALRADLHRLFDRGYVTVDEDSRFVVSDRLREDYDNGKTYYALHGRELFMPTREDRRPSAERLAWHRETLFMG